MKPPPFDYVDPQDLGGVLQLLADAGDDAAVIAGGQSLVPLLNLRLARPELVIDPRHLQELRTIDFETDGLRVGAMARVADLEEHPSLDQMPGLIEVLALIGHSQIRARTTIGGSIAHADPAAELPALLLALAGEVTLQSRDRGVRTVAARDFFVGPLMTERMSDELVTSIWLPYAPGPIAIAEVAKRPGDFAIVGAISSFGTDDGLIVDPRIALFGVGPTPIRATEAETSLVGKAPSSDVFAAAARIAGQHLNPRGDMHGSTAYRRQLAMTLTERTLGGAL
ncbi:MAG: carbon-monoxide dehydrogenase medium subunit [Verrucomicrobiales bacterium]|jgi:carbon-monoxide dehydrogenase medium subunit